MKLTFVLICVSAPVLSGCSRVGEQSQDAGSLPLSAEMREWHDPSTGCIYYIYRHGWGNNATGGMTAKLRADGTPECPNAPQIGPMT